MVSRLTSMYSYNKGAGRSSSGIEHSPVKVLIVWSIVHGRCIASLGYFLVQLVVHNWSIKSCGMCCPISGKVHIEDPLLLIKKSSLCGNSGFRLKKYVTMTIYLTSNSQWNGNQCALKALLNKINFPPPHSKKSHAFMYSNNMNPSTFLYSYSKKPPAFIYSYSKKAPAFRYSYRKKPPVFI